MSPHRIHHTSRRTRRGFTLVEIMLVVAIIALICAMAIPAVMISQRNAQGARFINDLRQATYAFETYAMEQGGYPDDVGPGVVPAGMADSLRGIRWAEPTVIGGHWDWQSGGGLTAGVGVSDPRFTADLMQRIDARIDDGSLASGQFRSFGGSYLWVIEE